MGWHFELDLRSLLGYFEVEPRLMSLVELGVIACILRWDSVCLPGISTEY